MKKLSELILLFFLLTYFVSCNSPSTDRFNRVELQLQNTDTILLVSHEQTYGPIFNKKNHTSIEAKKIVENGIINREVINETTLIEGQEKKELISILAKKVKGAPIELAACFDPHHAIIVINKKNISYIEFCFTCGGVSTDNLEISSADFDEEKWKKVYNYIDNKIPIKK